MQELHEVDIEDTQNRIQSTDNLKHRVVFIAGFLERKYSINTFEDTRDDSMISTEFVEELDRGGLHIPTLSTTFFVHSAVQVWTSLSLHKCSCRTYFIYLLSQNEAPIAENYAACQTLANVLLKDRVCDKSDHEQQLGCLCRREKLQ